MFMRVCACLDPRHNCFTDIHKRFLELCSSESARDQIVFMCANTFEKFSYARNWIGAELRCLQGFGNVRWQLRWVIASSAHAKRVSALDDPRRAGGPGFRPFRGWCAPRCRADYIVRVARTVAGRTTRGSMSENVTCPGCGTATLQESHRDRCQMAPR